MPEAIVIPFPSVRRADTSLGDDDALAVALRGLQDALTEQALAVKAWRFAMAELDLGVSALGAAMTAYDRSLTDLDGQLAGLRENANALELTAENALSH